MLVSFSLASFTCKTTLSAATYLFVLRSYTHDIEALSCDEVLIDGSALLAELGISQDDLAKAIRADIKEKTRCCASVGMGESYTAKWINAVLLFYKLKLTAHLFRVQHPLGSPGDPEGQARWAVLLEV